MCGDPQKKDPVMGSFLEAKDQLNYWQTCGLYLGSTLAAAQVHV